ncbi:copper chaperone PCu(A)C [Erythrobacter arachoides]|uniref:Copper chaperone PCu(A)C n=1 Tax=Aurantiacibacter arachoides TaxID=1850444 RepID=A0A845A131_9SPHN|nr:copper chaperone PCu(A)C [Aurantiacibacter arachoides]MXO93182.1 copper chaperone PCu(A)C [Aurantiacibacter arachoides]GGD51366.1 hypothetical protein GCM10011411_09010 [Aurantiacibacter arachoides]
MTKTPFFATLSLAAAALTLASCSEEPAPEVADAAADGDCVAGIAVTDGWLSLPGVAGNPAAAYFTITNTGTQPWTIRGADLLGAQGAMLHETSEWSRQEDMQELVQQSVEPGETLAFAPGGKHVMVMGLPADMVAGGQGEITLTDVRGDKCSFPVEIRAPGDAPETTATAENAAG